ncbi:MAG: hypothetical protein SPI25_05850 [Dialister sp.]|nr:hypothetical protein [Dialister sp.]
MNRKALFTSLAAAILLLSGGVFAADELAAPTVTKGKPSDAAAEAVKEDTNADSPMEELADIRKNPLTEEDFAFSGISLGSPIEDLKKMKGNPKKVIHGDVQDEYQWDDMAVTVNKELPAAYSVRRDLRPARKGWKAGIDGIYLSERAAVTARGIGIGSSRENVLRVYGQPEEVLWDGRKSSFILRYGTDDKGLDFGVKDNKVESIKLYSRRERKKSIPRGYLDISRDGSLPEADFRLAGYTMGDAFKAHPFDTWIKKMTNPKEEIWYYKGYAVRVSIPQNIVEAYFLEGDSMLSRRGLTLGDSISTVELLYGKPGKIELSSIGGNLRNAYIYFSPTKDKILIIYINKGKTDGFIIARNPQKQKALAAGGKK